MTPPGRPTIVDVAARAGVSKSLVSLALRGCPAVAPASREAILAAAAELGYRPNAAAQALAARSSRTVGVLVLDLHNPVFAEILDGVLAGVRARGYRTMVVTGTDAAQERPELDKLLEFRAEGLVLVSHRLEASALRAIAAETPVVVATRRDVTGPGIDTVHCDDREGAELAVRHLLALGHRRIAHLGGGDDPVAADREEGYRAAMAAAGLARHTVVLPGGLDDAAGHAAACAALALPERPTALFVVNDFAALGALAAVAEAGLSVPWQMSVVGYDGTRLSGLRSIGLTSVAQPLGDIGRLAAERLFDRIDGRRTRARHTVLPARLEERATTAPPA